MKVRNRERGERERAREMKINFKKISRKIAFVFFIFLWSFPTRLVRLWYIKKNHPPFCSTFALIAIPRTMASGLPPGIYRKANRRVQFFNRWKKKKKLNSSLSNQLHNSPFYLNLNISKKRIFWNFGWKKLQKSKKSKHPHLVTLWLAHLIYCCKQLS